MSTLDALIFGIRKVFFGGSELPTRDAMSFEGAAVSVVDDTVNQRIKVSIDAPTTAYVDAAVAAVQQEGTVSFTDDLGPYVQPASGVKVFFRATRAGSLSALKITITGPDWTAASAAWRLSVKKNGANQAQIDTTTVGAGGTGDLASGSTTLLWAGPIGFADGDVFTLTIGQVGGSPADFPTFVLSWKAA